jgi:Mg2+ and Co2+ transporter CorA
VGIQREATLDLRQYLDSGRFFWLDLAGGDDTSRAAFLHEAGLTEADSAWARRFGQTDRMMINSGSLRAVTRLATMHGLAEFHVWASSQCMVTVWDGDGSALDKIRAQFFDRIKGLEKSSYWAATVLMELVLETLDEATSDLDGTLQKLREQIERRVPSIDLGSFTSRLDELQTIWSRMDRYSSAVRTAIVAVDAVPQIGEHAATQLKDYADRVDDIERRLHGRYQRGMGLLQNYATAIAQRQSDQINRLTLVSIIFLPITFLTGFFGMNFGWMSKTLGGPAAFLLFGLALPAASIVLTLLWFKRRQLL